MEADGPIRVLIVEDHRMLADLMRTVLSGHDDIEVTGWARSVSEAHARVVADRPDVVLMDFQLPDGDGVSATRRIVADHPGVAVVMVTASVSDTVVTAALQAGCRGYITKDQPAEEVLVAVRAAKTGGSVISPEMLARALPRLSGGSAAPGRGPLTPRQLQILQLVAQAHSTGEIAARLAISPHTVRNHIQAVLDRLDVGSKLEAVTVARREGLLRQ